jgi:hypothetical protein
LLDHVVALFLDFQGHLHTIFHIDCTNIFTPKLLKDSLFCTPPFFRNFCLFDNSLLRGTRQYLTVVLIYIFSVIAIFSNNFWTFLNHSFEKRLFMSFVHF